MVRRLLCVDWKSNKYSLKTNLCFETSIIVSHIHFFRCPTLNSGILPISGWEILVNCVAPVVMSLGTMAGFSSRYLWNILWKHKRSVRNVLFFTHTKLCKPFSSISHVFAQGLIYIDTFWTRPLPRPIFFIFMQFSGKFGRIIGWNPLTEKSGFVPD